MNTGTFSLDSVQQTMLMTLAARAAAPAYEPDTDFVDPWGGMLVKSLPWDLSRYQQDRYFVRHVALRAKRMDRLTADFFKRNPGASGIGLGCGLCTRGRRLSILPDCQPFQWVDMDQPEVIAIRRTYLPPLEGERVIEGRVTDMAWLDEILHSNGPPLILVMEGVSSYLSCDENRSLFRDLGNRLDGTGTEMIFDYIHAGLVDSAYVSNMAGGIPTPFRSGFFNADGVRDLHPSIRVVAEYSTYSQISHRHLVYEMEFDAASLGEKPYTILHIRFGDRG